MLALAAVVPILAGNTVANFNDMEGEKMTEFVVAVLAFLSMMGAALLGLFSKTRSGWWPTSSS